MVIPTGYDVRERKLVINHEEAQKVRHIFERYLELGSVRRLKKDLDERGLFPGPRCRRKAIPGRQTILARSAVLPALQPNLPRRDPSQAERHAGQHEAMSAARFGSGSNNSFAAKRPAMVKAGRPRPREVHWQASFSTKAASRCTCREQQTATVAIAITSPGDWSGESLRMLNGRGEYPRPRIERSVSSAAQRLLGDRAATTLALEESRIDPNHLQSVLKSAQAWIERLKSSSEAASALGDVVQRIDLSGEGIRLSIKLPLLPTAAAKKAASPDGLSITKFVRMQMKRRGVEMRMILEDDTTATRIELSLLRAVARARRWADDLISGWVRSIDELARREGIDGRSLRRLIPLGFLAPNLVDAIAEGRQPVELTVKGLTRRIDLPLLWSAQYQALGIR